VAVMTAASLSGQRVSNETEVRQAGVNETKRFELVNDGLVRVLCLAVTVTMSSFSSLYAE
jgi:hypothetical protein